MIVCLVNCIISGGWNNTTDCTPALSTLVWGLCGRIGMSHPNRKQYSLKRPSILIPALIAHVWQSNNYMPCWTSQLTFRKIAHLLATPRRIHSAQTFSMGDWAGCMSLYTTFSTDLAPREAAKLADYPSHIETRRHSKPLLFQSPIAKPSTSHRSSL